MFGFFQSAAYWMFSTLFDIGFSFAENIVEWVLPIYMTLYILRNSQQQKYNNYIGFWCLASLVFLLDYLTMHTLHYIYFYRWIRFFFLIWIQLDYCQNSVYVLNSISPIIDKNRRTVDETIEKIDSGVDATYMKIVDNIKIHLGNLLQHSGSNVVSTVLNFTNSFPFKHTSSSNFNVNNDETISSENTNNTVAETKKENDESTSQTQQ